MNFIFGFLFSLPLLVVTIQCFIVIFLKKNHRENGDIKQEADFIILMPAHNEAAIIGKTLSYLLEQVSAQSVIVIADNCTDNTAEIVRSFGIKVLERFNESEKGKGFALDFGIQYLKQKNSDNIVIIMDADCVAEKNVFKLLCHKVIEVNRPVQALYMMDVPKEVSMKQKVSVFAWMVKNKIRPSAMQRLNLPIILTGTGMAFPMEVFDKVKLGSGNIVEDMQLGIDCTLNGFKPMFCEEAVVYSQFPEQPKAERTQRTRWEHGHLMTIAQQVPKLLKQAVMRRNGNLLGLALDIAVPPLSLLVIISLFGLFFMFFLSFLNNSFLGFYLLLTSFLFFICMLMMIWQRYGQEYLTLKELCSVPAYVISKFSIYTTFIFKRQKEWVRTDRDE